MQNLLIGSAEDEGFEPSVGCPTHAFQACALGRYANPPFIQAKSILRFDLPYNKIKSNNQLAHKHKLSVKCS